MKYYIYLDTVTIPLTISLNGTFAYSTVDLPEGRMKFRAKQYESIEFVCTYGKHSVKGVATPENSFMDVLRMCLRLVGLE